MAKNEKFYTVWKGKRPGIYTTWDDCKAAITGYKGAQYKAFATFAIAKKAFNGNYEEYKGTKKGEASLSPEQLIKDRESQLPFYFGRCGL